MPTASCTSGDPRPPRRIRRPKQPTLDEVKSWPATVDLATAATAFGMSRSHAYETARRGEFPARVLPVGGRYRVITASVLAVLSEGAA